MPLKVFNNRDLILYDRQILYLLLYYKERCPSSLPFFMRILTINENIHDISFFFFLKNNIQRNSQPFGACS